MMPAALGPVQVEADGERTEAAGAHVKVRQPAVVRRPSQMHNEQRGRQKRTVDGPEEGPPRLLSAHGRAQAGLQALCELAESIPQLRRQVVSTSSRRGVHDSQQTCVNADLAGLIGVGTKGWFVLWTAMREGRLPGKLLGCDRTWVESIEFAERLHAVRYWVSQGIVELDMLQEKLARPLSLTVRREGPPAKKQVCSSPSARGTSGRGASSAPDEAGAADGAPSTPLTMVIQPVLGWRHEEEELKRAVMVSALT